MADNAALIERQLVLAGLIAKFEANTLKCGRAAFTSGFLRGRRQLLERYWDEFQNNHRESHQDVTLREDAYFQEDRFSTTELQYSRALGFVYDEEARLVPAASGGNVNVESSRAAPLPKISLPTFSGHPEDWESYRDLFRSLIHQNSNLSGVQKLHYLKTSVQGEAKRAIDSITTTEANYSVAWSLLLERYDDKQLLAQKHMTDLASIRSLKDESSSGLRGLLDQITRSREALRALEQPVDNWNAWFIFFAARGMDMMTRREWQRWIKTKEAPLTYDHLKEFLQETIQTLRTLETARGSGREAPTSRSKPPQEARHSSRVLTISSNDYSCQVCRKSHHLGRCDEFKRMTIAQRRTLANRSKLCYNCLRSGHNAQNCDSSYRCRECNRRHHSMLHPPASGKRTATNPHEDEPANKRAPATTGECRLSPAREPATGSGS